MNALTLSFLELADTIKNWRIWTLLAWQDIKLRYRRSTLGPLWITISMAVTIYSMGFLYGHLFRTQIDQYFPFLAAGIVTWGMMSAIINDSTNAFIEAEQYLRNLELPYSIFICRIVLKNFIIFLHNIIAVIPIYFFFDVKLNWEFFFILPGILVILINGVLYGAVLGFLGARYRDLGQIIQSIIQVIFFLTPIMWQPNLIPEKYRTILDINPVFHFINLIRGPLTGTPLTALDFLWVLIATTLGFLFFVLLSARSRHRLVFWL